MRCANWRAESTRARLDDIPLAVDPFGFNRLLPGTLGGHQEGQDPHAFARLFDLSVVGADPGPHRLALVPGGIIPNQEPMRLAVLAQPLTTPLQELDGDGTRLCVP